MEKLETIKVPVLGDFKDVEIIDVMIKPDVQIEQETPMITLETDKASMDIPSPVSLRVVNVLVKLGDLVSEGDPIAEVIYIDEKKQAIESAAVSKKLENSYTGLVVIGGGPGGYTTAFRAADLGLSVTLIEKFPVLGGVCLNVGCIPSKSLLHCAEVLTESQTSANIGITFTKPEIDWNQVLKWKESVTQKLNKGLDQLVKERKINRIQGTASFTSQNQIQVISEANEQFIDFKQAVIATGSHPFQLPNFPEHKDIIDSTGALALTEVPKSMLIIGGGIIGLEMATVYQAFGTEITIVEMLDQLVPPADIDLVKPLQMALKKKGAKILLSTQVISIDPVDSGLNVSFKAKKDIPIQNFKKVLVAVGRKPNTQNLGLEKIGIQLNDQGFIRVNAKMQSNLSHIFAIGDVIGNPMLAHKAVHEGKIAAEVAAGKKSVNDVKVIPSVAYTHPEIAWVGITEKEAKSANIDYEKAVFPWAANGKSLSMNQGLGATKLLFEPQSKALLGAGIVGKNAGEMIAELALAIEMGCDAEDISLTSHPHPTLSESVKMAAEIFDGSITDLPNAKK
jgi:dihydrolipoamide dehydrogenase